MLAMQAASWQCSLCGSAEVLCSEHYDRDVKEFGCPACGNFEITREAEQTVQYDPEAKGLRHLISAATRQASDEKHPVTIMSANWRDLADRFAGVTVTAKVRRLLEVLRKRSDFFGNTVEFSAPRDWPLLVANGPEECVAILFHAREQKLIAPTLNLTLWKLTWDGWQTVEPIAAGAIGLGFVAMAFSDDLKDAYQNGILAAIEDCGFQALRIDKAHFTEKICDRIIVEIRRAQFVVADFTHQRGGVYFEAGYAHALGRIVIWTCREDDLPNLHFDTRQYPHIVWREAADLRIQLRDRLQALVPGALRR